MNQQLTTQMNTPSDPIQPVSITINTSISPNNTCINPLHIQQTSQITCRICLDIQPKQSIISPCNCKGSTKHVHQTCLLQWANKNNKPIYNQLTQSFQLPCQICKHRIPIQKQIYKQKRNCQQIRSLLIQYKIKYTIQIVAILCMIVCIGYMIEKFIEFDLENNKLFQYIVIGIICVQCLATLWLSWLIYMDIAYARVYVYKIKKGYECGRVGQDGNGESGVNFGNQMHINGQ